MGVVTVVVGLLVALIGAASIITHLARLCQ